MTKAKARTRAKARAAVKAASPGAKSTKPEVKQRPGHFDAKSNTMGNVGGRENLQSAASMRRGAARSR